MLCCPILIADTLEQAGCPINVISCDKPISEMAELAGYASSRMPVMYKMHGK